MIGISNKAFHLTGSYFFITMLRRYFTRRAAVWITAVGAVLLEAYQHLFEPGYDGKWMDTVFDLIADAIGIWLGAR